MTIEKKIRQRRLQMLVHSCIYYEFNESLVTDSQWATWAKELVKLQEEYPSIADKVEWADAFRDFDASTGYNLPVRDPWVMRKARQLLIWHKIYCSKNTDNNTCVHDKRVCELW